MTKSSSKACALSHLIQGNERLNHYYFLSAGERNQ